MSSIEELASLVDRTRSAPALTNNHPFQNVHNEYYWSATTYPLNDGNLSYAHTVHFGNGSVQWDFKTSSAPRAWCVRSGQGVDGN